MGQTSELLKRIEEIEATLEAITAKLEDLRRIYREGEKAKADQPT